MKYKRTPNYENDRKIAEEIGLIRKNKFVSVPLINNSIETRIRIGYTWFKRIITREKDIVYYLGNRVLNFEDIASETITGYGDNTPEWKKKVNS